MLKPDDSSLSVQEYTRVRSEAEKLLSEADSIGVFPTPVSDIMEAGQVTLVSDEILDESFLRKMRKAAGDSLRRALSKVLGLFDARARLVFIDRKLLAVKQTFIKLHETGHGFLPWQRDLYAVIEDGKQELDPDTAELFDREANVFATEVLFQLDGFINEAARQPFGIKVPLSLSKKYGASVYASVRQYVSKNGRACAVLVLNPPEFKDGDGFETTLRRSVLSLSFVEVFGNINWPLKFTPSDEIGAMVPIGKQRMSRPREIELSDRNGELHVCIAEAFTTGYQVFVLIHDQKTLNKTSIILPPS